MKEVFLILDKSNQSTDIYFLKESEAKKFVDLNPEFTYQLKKCYQTLQEYNLEINSQSNKDYLNKKLEYLNNDAKYAVVLNGKEVYLTFKNIKSIIYTFKKGETKHIWINNKSISIADYPKILIAYNEGKKAIKNAKNELKEIENEIEK